MIFGINTTRYISKLSQISLAYRLEKLRITILKYHSWYLCQIPLLTMPLPKLILFVYKLMSESSKYNRENCPRKCFWTQERETRVKFNPGLSANRPSNNWAQNIVVISLYKRPFAILETKRKLGQVNFCKDFWDWKQIGQWRVPSNDPRDLCVSNLAQVLSQF